MKRTSVISGDYFRTSAGTAESRTFKELSGVFNFRNLKQVFAGHMPGQLIIQITDSCNAQCPQCEMRVTNRYERSTLDEQSVERILAVAAQRDVAAVSFTGGEPFLHLDMLARLIQRAGDGGIPFIRTGTNGYFLRSSDVNQTKQRAATVAAKLAATPLRNFWFSLDSAQADMHDQIRGFPGLYRNIGQALPVFHDHGIWPTANLGINRNFGGKPLRMADNPNEEDKAHFRQQCLGALRKFYQTAIDMGFTIINFCYPMSVESDPANGLSSAYRASSAHDIVSFTKAEKIELFSAMFEAVKEFRQDIRIFTPRSMIKVLVDQYAEGVEKGYACRGGIDFFFIDSSQANTYPCGFRSDEKLGRFWEADWSLLRKQEATCTRCDWECFRDPSNMIGPLLDLRSHPSRLFSRMFKEPEWMKLWWEDLRYQRATDYCNGRAAPNYQRMRCF